MTINQIAFSSSVTTPKADQVVVLGVANIESTLSVSSSSAHPGITAKLMKQLGLQSSMEASSLAVLNEQAFLFIGVGDGSPSIDELREIAGAAVRQCATATEIVFDLPTSSTGDVKAILEGALLGAYSFERYKSAPKKETLNSIRVITKHKLSRSTVEKLSTVTRAVIAARDLGNTPPNDSFPASFAAALKKAAKGKNVTLEIWDVKKLAEEKCVGILNVGKGSVRPPRLVKIEYKPKGATKHLALVGKGITFDSGGLTLKPGLGMLDMKFDMSGAACIAQATLAIAELELPIRVTAFMCVAENLPSGSATRPSDVIVFRNGKSVEVTNTDAEGRLVLADGLILASELRPDLIVDVATLTGAARVALGVRTAGLMGTPKAVELVQQASTTAGEATWAMPLPKELRSLLKSDIADLINSKLGNPTGSMLVGGHFLREFIGFKAKSSTELIDWAHLDIAGPANNEGSPYGYTPKGATGVMIRTLVELAKAL
jgi:leucyl aminopeptidase